MPLSPSGWICGSGHLSYRLGCRTLALTRSVRWIRRDQTRAAGFAEWLAITYGDNGIGVTCACPRMGVATAARGHQ